MIVFRHVIKQQIHLSHQSKQQHRNDHQHPHQRQQLQQRVKQRQHFGRKNVNQSVIMNGGIVWRAVWNLMKTQVNVTQSVGIITPSALIHAMPMILKFNEE